MIIEGNKFKKWFGNLITKIGELVSGWGSNILTSNKDIIISNPTCKLANPYTLIVVFTVGTNTKYQIVLEGDYKESYKDSEDGVPKITEENLFDIIYNNQDNWFKRE